MKNVFFIGNRFKLFEEVIKFKELKFSYIFVLDDSFLERRLKDTEFEYSVFGIIDKQDVIERISEAEYDILISKGCPFIMPVSKIRKAH